MNIIDSLQTYSLARDESMYQRLYDKSIKAPDDFWSAVARELPWQESWQSINERGDGARQWFVGGRISLFDAVFHNKDMAAEALVCYTKTDERRAFTWGELKSMVASIGAYLRNDLNIEAGDVVCFSVENKQIAALYALGCLAIGAKFCFSYFRFTTEQLVSQVNLLGAKVLIYESFSTDGITSEMVPSLKTIALVSPTEQSISGVNSVALLSFAEIERQYAEVDFKSHTFSADEPCMYFLTSGTTAVPKAIPSGTAEVFVSAYATYLTLFASRTHTTFITMDFAWGAAVIPMFFTPLILGEKVVIDEVFLDLTSPRVAHIFNQERVGSSLIPIALFEKNIPVTSNVQFETLERVVLGGMKVSKKAIETIVSVFNNSRLSISYGYGSSEIGGLAFYCRAHEQLETFDFSKLKPAFGLQYQVNEHGRLLLKNHFPGFCKTIIGQEDKYLQSWTENYDYFITDDGAIDHGGLIEVMGRADTLIKVKGRFVDTAKLFEVCQEAYGVQTILIDVPRTDGTQRIVLFVEAVESAHINESGFIRLVQEKIGNYATPAQVVFVAEFPRTHSGKVKLGDLASLVV